MGLLVEWKSVKKEKREKKIEDVESKQAVDEDVKSEKV